MKVQYSHLTDFDAWLMLAREVAYLFGPMADEPAFQDALREAINDGTAFCVKPENAGKDPALEGGIVISKPANEIAWLAVSEKARGKGYGKALLEFAINHLDQQEDIFVHTFDESNTEGRAARKLYQRFGFNDHEKGDLNPAGVPTVIMRLPKP